MEKTAVLENASPANNERIWILDALRVPAIMAVIGFHAYGATLAHKPGGDASSIEIGWLQGGGVFGVTLFLILSGFGTHLAGLRRGRKNLGSRKWKVFFARRFYRIYPSYFAAIVFSILLNIFWAGVKGRNWSEHVPGLVDLASHLALLQTWMPTTFFGVVPAFWFVGLIAQLYLLYPVYVQMRNLWGEQNAFLVSLLITLLFRLGAWWLSRSLAADSNWHAVLWMNGPTRWFEWTVGAYLAWLIDTQRSLYGIVGLCSFVAALLWLTFQPLEILQEPGLALFLALAMWGGVTVTTGIPKIKAVNAMIVAGEMSYAYYLLHQIFIPYIASFFSHWRLSSAAFCLIIFIIDCAITSLISLLLYKYIELPFARGKFNKPSIASS